LARKTSASVTVPESTLESERCLLRGAQPDSWAELEAQDLGLLAESEEPVMGLRAGTEEQALGPRAVAEQGVGLLRAEAGEGLHLLAESEPRAGLCLLSESYLGAESERVGLRRRVCVLGAEVEEELERGVLGTELDQIGLGRSLGSIAAGFSIALASLTYRTKPNEGSDGPPSPHTTTSDEDRS
jgi:hypothetical protein